MRFFQKPLPGVEHSVTPAKNFSESVTSIIGLPMPEPERKKPLDHSMGRMEHILGRYRI